MGKVIFWHTYLINEYKLVVQEQLMKLITSGLYNEVDRIYVGIISPSDENTNWFINLLSSYPKCVFRLHDTNDAEKCTMRDVVDFSKQNDAYVMYFHTKAVSNTGYNNTLWRWSMDYNLMYRHNECIELLDNGVDAVGCNLRKDTYVGYYPHFSGTYWWSTTNYIKTLNKDYLYNKEMLGAQNSLSVEFYIGSNPNGNLQSIFECKHEAPYSVETLINEYLK